MSTKRKWYNKSLKELFNKQETSPVAKDGVSDLLWHSVVSETEAWVTTERAIDAEPIWRVLQARHNAKSIVINLRYYESNAEIVAVGNANGLPIDRTIAKLIATWLLEHKRNKIAVELTAKLKQ